MHSKEFSRQYLAYIESPLWAAQRSAALLRWGKACNACNRGHGYIQVHHLAYRNLRDVTTDDLMPLCARCHDLCHENKDLVAQLLNCKTSEEKRNAITVFVRELRRDSDKSVYVVVRRWRRANPVSRDNEENRRLWNERNEMMKADRKAKRLQYQRHWKERIGEH